MIGLGFRRDLNGVVDAYDLSGVTVVDKGIVESISVLIS
jgi:hypothetical protein